MKKKHCHGSNNTDIELLNIIVVHACLFVDTVANKAFKKHLKVRRTKNKATFRAERQEKAVNWVEKCIFKCTQDLRVS